LLNTINRTGKVLNLFTAETPEWGVTELATTLGLPKSTTFDIVASLAEIGLLQQTLGDRYRLGWRVLVISRRLMSSTCFNVHTHRTVAELANHLGAIVTIGAWDGQGVVCLANASARRTERVLADDWSHLSGHASALGKLLMTQLPWSKAQEWIDRYGLPRLTENSISDVNVLRAQLIAARDRDIAVEHGETIVGQSCVAVGIYPRERHAIAALSICVPSEKLQTCHEEYARIARRTARTLLRQGISSQVSQSIDDGGGDPSCLSEPGTFPNRRGR
jgi:DNA-binding IclR family transcriptional regulator